MAGVESVSAQRGQELLERVDIFERARLADVSSVKQDMYSYVFDPFFFTFGNHRTEMVYVRMHVAVGKQPYEVKGSAGLFNITRKLVPGVGFEQSAGIDSI